MKKISLWAKHHKWQARLVITVSFILLIGLGIVTGSFLRDLGILLPGLFLWLIVLLVFLAVIIYPDRKIFPMTEQAKNRHYFTQKSCDLALSLSTYLLVVCLANQPQHILPANHLFNQAMATKFTTVPGDSTQDIYQSLANFKKSVRDENGDLLKWKERKKMLKVQVKAIKNSKELSDEGKAGLIILAVLIAVGIAFGLMMLVCSLSCGGSAIGAIALISGIALFIFLLFLVIKKIRKKSRPNTEKEPSPGT